ncbi:MAG: HAMP domain-containing sensor histidine kinase [Alphaproteobacteria bacterium]
MAESRVYSLQGRLVLRLALIFLAGALIMTGGLVWKAVSAFGSLRDRSLQAQAGDVARMLVERPDGGLALEPDEALLAGYRRWGDGYLFALYDADRKIVLASSRAAGGLLAGHLPTGPLPDFFRLDAPADQPYHGYALTKADYVIAVAQGDDIHHDVLSDSLIREFIGESAVWLVPVVLVALLVGVRTIRSSMAPLQKLSAEAMLIAPERTDVRLRASTLPREVEPLVSAVNQALERLEQGFAMQRRFTADAAHELRTPLAVLTARIEQIEDGAARAALLKDVDRLNRLIEQLLAAARLDAAPLDLETPLDLRAAAEDAIASIAPRAVRDGRALELGGAAGPVWVRAAPAAAETAILNLLDNAMNYTPTGTPIEVAVTKEGALTVTDHGPGIPAEQRAGAFRRFWRGAEQAAGAKPGPCAASGAGLGLAIVAEAMRAMGGSAAIEDAPGGGARLRLAFEKVAAPLS